MYDTNLVWDPCAILSACLQLVQFYLAVISLYDINLRATTTTILSTRGVMIHATDSIRWCIVLFKLVTVQTSDPKSEFLCQLSLCCAEPADPPPPQTTLDAWDISHALTNMYHPYCHSPSALTKYLKAKLHSQRAKHLSRSLPAQVEQNIPLECNMAHHYVIMQHLGVGGKPAI